MNELSEDLDVAACLRRARHWTLALIGVLAINFSLVALALAGFGARQEPPRPALAAQPMPPPTVARTAEAANPPAQATLQQPAEVAPPVPPAPDVQPAVAVTAPVVDPTPSVLPLEPPVAPNPPPAPALATGAPPPAADSLIIVNPPLTGGAVHFALDGALGSLQPGQYCELSGTARRRVEYHRGEDFGYASHECYRGCFAFEVGDRGWTLKPLDAAAERALLGRCVRQW